RNADLEPNVANVQGRVRYDAFFHRHISAFLMTTARYDRFQGLDLRLNVDPGFAFYILPKPKHRLWAEVGYDFQYDLRRSDSIIQRDEFGIPVLDENNNTIRIADKYFINHAA